MVSFVLSQLSARKISAFSLGLVLVVSFTPHLPSARAQPTPIPDHVQFHAALIAAIQDLPIETWRAGTPMTGTGALVWRVEWSRPAGGTGSPGSMASSTGHNAGFVMQDWRVSSMYNRLRSGRANRSAGPLHRFDDRRDPWTFFSVEVSTIPCQSAPGYVWSANWSPDIPGGPVPVVNACTSALDKWAEVQDEYGRWSEWSTSVGLPAGTLTWPGTLEAIPRNWRKAAVDPRFADLMLTLNFLLAETMPMPSPDPAAFAVKGLIILTIASVVILADQFVHLRDMVEEWNQNRSDPCVAAGTDIRFSTVAMMARTAAEAEISKKIPLLGIERYSTQRLKIRVTGTSFSYNAHHIIQARFFEQFGYGHSNEMPAVILSVPCHKCIDRAILKRLPKGRTYTQEEVCQGLREVYDQWAPPLLPVVNAHCTP